MEATSLISLLPKGNPAPAEYFTGIAWIQPLVSSDSSFNCQMAHVLFEPGARNHWHIHPAGQVLFVTEGLGYYQEKGKPIQLIQKGDTIHIPPNIEHWHGASPSIELSHLAITAKSEEGVVIWKEAVSDRIYNQFE